MVCQYDRAKYGSRVDWTKESFVIDGRPVVVLGGEFHYWRVPDRERWSLILTQYKAMGLNAIRIYCHWGYHSPAQGVYIFEGGRDVDYLLSLCQELNLWVIAACGPYICAETQGGGYPTWLIAKREVRIRHMKASFRKKWDDSFHTYCMEWWQRICPIFAKYERVTNPQGPVIAFQVENELSERIALNDEVLKLAESARQFGINSPIFHNDAMPEGSFAKGDNGTDLYGIDLYFTFAPKDGSQDSTSCLCVAFTCGGCVACTQAFGCNGLGINGNQTKALKCLFRSPLAPPHRLKPLSWSPKSFSKSIDNYESKMRSGIGGRAATGPVVMAETQVGWINQWARTRNYDDLYDFFGTEFSATLLSTLTAQGMTCVNFYIPYGGTNYGASGDTEVYTSYDYSGLIREHGLFSERARKLRLINLFVRSFGLCGGLTTSTPTALPKTTAATANQPRGLICSIPELLHRIRLSSQGNASFAFLRNFLASDESQVCSIAADGVVLRYELLPRQAAIIPLRYPLPAPAEPYQVLVTSLKVMTRTHYSNADLWICNGTGEIVLNNITGSNKTSEQPATLVVSWSSLATQIEENKSPDEVTIGPADPNSQQSVLQAPLEELPMQNGGEDSIISAVASTEPIAGFCYTITVHQLPCVVTISEIAHKDIPLVRLLCLSSEDASTFTMQIDSGSERYCAAAPQRSAMFGWGAEEIRFLDVEGTSVSVDRAHKENSRIFIFNDGHALPSSGRPLGSVVSKLLPGGFVFDFEGRADDDGMMPAQDPWRAISFEWQDESKSVEWKSIDYDTERDPLDHHFTSGHVSYRCRFRTSNTKLSVKINVRHIGTVWLNGVLIGGQVTYSHNLVSAGAMNFLDFTWAGNEIYDLGPHLVSGEEDQEMIILVHSLGQSRNPFMVNDVRNRRGLLSAKFCGGPRPSEVRWDIHGVAVSSLSDPFNTCGLPCERSILEDLSRDRWPWSSTDRMIIAGSGISWFCCDFTSSNLSSKNRVPVCLSTRCVDRVSAFMWVNGFFVGIYISYMGPQQEFYVMDGLLKPEHEKNQLVVAAYGPASNAVLQVRVVPWIVDRKSGNVATEDAGGQAFLLAREMLRFERAEV